MVTSNQTDSGVENTVMMPALASGPKANPPAASPAQGKPVAFVEGSRPDFSSETNNLLRGRLRQVALILSLGYSAFLLKSWIFPSYDPNEATRFCFALMVVVTAFIGLIAYRLCIECQYALQKLRTVENLIFGSSAILFVAVGYANLVSTAEDGYLINISPPWMILIFTYVLFIPATFQRSLWTIIPLAFGPWTSLCLAWLTHPEVKALIDNTTDFHHVFLEAFMGMAFTSALAIGGVRQIRSLRTQAFEAQQLGQYRLKRLLGRGGMGEVYLAEHLMLKRPCAVKIIRPEKAGDPATLARFEQEVQATAKLTHWNTVEIYDFGRTDDGTFYYVMEYLPGMSLDQIVDMHGPLPPERVIHLLAQTCDALAEAHGQCLVHRDIKPANIFAAKRGGAYDVAKLLDFGLVRSLASDAAPHLTQESVVTGSPLYMSPEQARGDDVDGRSDIYALGCAAYFMLSGKTPFQEDKAIKLLLAHAQKVPERLAILNPSIPADLEQVVMKCLEKLPEDRFQSVLELREALLNCSIDGAWTRTRAVEWWQANGCPQKRELDHFVSQGIDLNHRSQLQEETSAMNTCVKI
ncbi:serine/threonine protein kinase [Planctomicrobium sp. SH527]|uniref:serine/threonine protein kinase n=1 Tax=Planctomicrobium sp. SH527 TaxID=3448123 RepID=UPI003F5B11D6